NFLIDVLLGRVNDYEHRFGARHYKRGRKAKRDFRQALEGFVGDLMRAQSSESAKGWVYRAMRPAGFTGEDVSFRTFQRLIDALGEVRMIERRVGFQDWTSWDATGPKYPSSWKYASRFRATKKLIKVCTDAGVHIADVGGHFIAGLPKK